MDKLVAGSLSSLPERKDQGRVGSPAMNSTAAVEPSEREKERVKQVQWPRDMLPPPLPSVVGFFSPVVRTALAHPAPPTGSFDSQPRPPKPDYRDPRAWAARPVQLASETSAVHSHSPSHSHSAFIPLTAEMVPPSVNGLCFVCVWHVCAWLRLLHQSRVSLQISNPRSIGAGALDLQIKSPSRPGWQIASLSTPRHILVQTGTKTASVPLDIMDLGTRLQLNSRIAGSLPPRQPSSTDHAEYGHPSALVAPSVPQLFFMLCNAEGFNSLVFEFKVQASVDYWSAQPRRT